MRFWEKQTIRQIWREYVWTLYVTIGEAVVKLAFVYQFFPPLPPAIVGVAGMYTSSYSHMYHTQTRHTHIHTYIYIGIGLDISHVEEHRSVMGMTKEMGRGVVKSRGVVKQIRRGAICIPPVIVPNRLPLVPLIPVSPSISRYVSVCVSEYVSMVVCEYGSMVCICLSMCMNMCIV